MNRSDLLAKMIKHVRLVELFKYNEKRGHVNREEQENYQQEFENYLCAKVHLIPLERA